MPNALVITAAGINCDRELAEAFEHAGAENAELVHLSTLMTDPDLIDDYDLIGLPGGFSYGDAVAAGRVAAAMMRETVYPALLRAIERRAPMIAPCNGFQIAALMGLLPGIDHAADDETSGGRAPTPTVTLARNRSACFIDRWTRVEVPAGTRCIWTRGLDMDETTGVLPIAHGEGRFIPQSPELLQSLEANGQVAVRYAAEDNPNGSVGDVAGLCDPTGLLFGLMPHPERYTRWTQHPFWSRLDPEVLATDPPGLRIFRNAVEYVEVTKGVAPAGGAYTR